MDGSFPARERAAAGFSAAFGYPPALLVRAPGRVNLIGGHTDYNEGFVLPMAVDRAVWVAVAGRADPVARIVALDYGGEEVSFPLISLPPRDGSWADYPRGVAWALQGPSLVGLEAAIASDLPVGAGLSSSAAVEIAFGWAWRLLSGLDIDRRELALVCQRAENEYVGVRCGVMDQMAVALGQAGSALLLDCRTLEVEPVPLPEGVVVVVADTGLRRTLAASVYNRRRQECEEAVRLLAPHLPALSALRDLSPGGLTRFQHLLPAVLRQRAWHVVTENDRVLRAVEAMRTSDLERVGEAMRLSHESLRDAYEVSSPELDLLAETAWGVEGCYGARLTGGGFGGCVVALAAERAVRELTARLITAYQGRFGRRPAVGIYYAAGGVSHVSGS